MKSQMKCWDRATFTRATVNNVTNKFHEKGKFIYLKQDQVRFSPSHTANVYLYKIREREKNRNWWNTLSLDELWSLVEVNSFIVNFVGLSPLKEKKNIFKNGQAICELTEGEVWRWLDGYTVSYWTSRPEVPSGNFSRLSWQRSVVRILLKPL